MRIKLIAWPPAVTQLQRGLAPIAISLALGVVLSVSGFALVRHLYRTEAQTDFETPAAAFAGAVSQSLDHHLEGIQSVAAFLSAANAVDRWEFFELARDLLPRYPGMLALSWVPRIAAADREAYETRARADGLFGFTFKEPSLAGKGKRAAVRAVHFPVYYVEPFEGNEGRLGLDLAANLKDLELFAKARDTASPMIAPGERASSTHHGTLLVVAVPVFRAGKVPQTLAKRRDGLVGFARAILDPVRMVDAALPGPAAPPGLDIYLYDEAAAGRRLIANRPSPLRPVPSAPLAEDEVRNGLSAEVRRELGGRSWSIVVKPVESYLNANVTTAAWGVFTVGLLLTALLVQYLVSSHSRTRVIERTVIQRTAKLRTANQALRSEIQERERIELALRAAKNKAQTASRAKSEFLAMMGHELRTPLNAVIGFSELLTGESLGPLGHEKYRGYARDIRQSGTDLLERINDILDLTKLDSDDFRLHEEAVSLTAMCEAVLPAITAKASAAALDLQTEFTAVGATLQADPRAVKQILFNLLSNAVKFTPAGGQITVASLLRDDGRLELRVSDTGVGMEPQHLNLVLRPFSQIDSSLARKYEGSGLGLALTHKLVQIHGGTLAIDSAIDKGTTVRVIFPEDRVRSSVAADEVA